MEITIDTISGALTFIKAVSFSPSKLAVIVAVPADSPVASPLLLMVAIPLLDEDHVAEDVMLTTEPSV